MNECVLACMSMCACVRVCVCVCLCMHTSDCEMESLLFLPAWLPVGVEFKGVNVLEDDELRQGIKVFR